MANLTATNVGTFSVSGSALKSAIDTLTITLSGQLYLLPTAGGQQVCVYMVDRT